MVEPDYTCPVTNKPCAYGLPCGMFFCNKEKPQKAIKPHGPRTLMKLRMTERESPERL